MTAIFNFLKICFLLPLQRITCCSPGPLKSGFRGWVVKELMAPFQDRSGMWLMTLRNTE